MLPSVTVGGFTGVSPKVCASCAAQYHTAAWQVI